VRRPARKSSPSTADVLAELRARLDLQHFDDVTRRRLDRAFDKHADGEHDSGLLELLRIARFLRVDGTKVQHYAPPARQARRACPALDEASS
jgi:hypothetical protein